MTRLRRLLHTFALAAAVAAVGPQTASAATLSGPAHGVVDLGDRVAYEVHGRECARMRVSVRVVVAGARTQSRPSRSRASASSTECSGVATVPGFAAVVATGWAQGDPLSIELVSRAGRVPLRYQRVELDEGLPAAGAPEVTSASDEDTGGRDKAVVMSTGDSVALGRVGVRNVDSVALRLCVRDLPIGIEAPVFVSVHQDAPDGPALIEPVNVADSPDTFLRLSTSGFPGCYRLVTLPLTGRPVEDAPELFLTVDATIGGSVEINSIDFNGTGAKLPSRFGRDPGGMRTIFDGTSFDGWTQTGCTIRDGAATNLRSGDPLEIAACDLKYSKPLHNVAIRLELRRESFFDNGGLYLGADEIQVRSAGEWLPGGYFGESAARWQKIATFPDWSTVEIVQLGARHVVTINGRTVTDHMRAGGDPGPFTFNPVTQPQYSYRTGVSVGFGNEGNPEFDLPSEWGAFWYRNVRVLECAGESDPVCVRLADARRGQQPRTHGTAGELADPPAG